MMQPIEDFVVHVVEHGADPQLLERVKTYVDGHLAKHSFNTSISEERARIAMAIANKCPDHPLIKQITSGIRDGNW